MATRNRKTSARSAGAWFGLSAGMVLGVGAAVAVALFVTQVPMPFMDKASRSTPSTLLPDVPNAPDPNIGLYGKDGPAGIRSPEQGGGTSNPPAPAPAESGNPLADDIGKLIAGLTGPASPAPAAPRTPAPPPAATPATPPAAPSPAAPAGAAATPAPGTQTIYYLQTGAFRSKEDAEAMRARVLLLGFPVRIEQAQSNGGTINRVRVGPFKGIDEMNRARTQLGNEKIESSVVRP